MKYLFLTASLLLFACGSKPEFKYKITKDNYYKGRPAIFYTDTLEFNGDTMGYHNTDGSYVFISDSLGFDCFIDTLK